MSHKHPIYDDDKQFSIDGVSRVITAPVDNKPVLVQYDHNSEHVTFICDRFVEGHDLLLSNKVEVHYTNTSGRFSSRGVYPVEDLKKHDSNDSKIVFTWIISEHATRYVGPLRFVVTFTCLDVADITYRWSTNVNSDLVVSECIDNGEAVEGTYADVLEMWKQDLFGIGDTEEASMRALSETLQQIIEAKGGFVLDSIPDDYANLQNEVNNFYADVKTLKESVLNAVTINEVENVELTLNYGYYMDTNGVSVEFTDPLYCVSDKVTVVPGDVYVITGYNYAENPTYVFYDSYGNVIGRNDEYNASSGTYSYRLVVIAPRNAATVAINGRDPGYTPYLAHATVYCNSIDNYVKNIITPLVDDKNYTTAEVGYTELISKCIISGEIVDVESEDDQFIITELIPVKEGEMYRLQTSLFTDNDVYIFYNHNGDILAKRTGTVSEAYASFEDVLIAPRNATHIRIASSAGTGSIQFEKIIRVDNPKYLKWSDKKWVAVGDSLTETNLRATKNYHDYIAEDTGITVVNMGSSGTGYLRAHDEGKAFYQRISSIPTDADVVTIFGSGNDLAAGELGLVTDTGTETLCGAINTTLDNLFNVLPLAKVGLVTPTPWGGYKPGNDNDMELYSEAIVQICKNRGIPCLDLYHCSGLRPWDATYLPLAYSRDEGNSVHPDENGHAIIASRFKAFLETLMI